MESPSRRDVERLSFVALWVGWADAKKKWVQPIQGVHPHLPLNIVVVVHGRGHEANIATRQTFPHGTRRVQVNNVPLQQKAMGQEQRKYESLRDGGGTYDKF
jgi:hypothetical protein